MSRRHVRAGKIGAASRRLVAAYEGAETEHREAGRAWYPSAAAEAERIAAASGLEPSRCAAVIAALSPQTRWRENVAAAETVCLAAGRGDVTIAGVPLPGYKTNHAKAWALATGASLTAGPGRDGFGGEAPKVRAFYAAICGDLDSVTLDVWAMRAAYPSELSSPPSGDRYRRGVASYKAAARRCGEHPRDFQAIVWLATRGLAEHARDRMALAQGELFRPTQTVGSEL